MTRWHGRYGVCLMLGAILAMGVHVQAAENTTRELRLHAGTVDTRTLPNLLDAADKTAALPVDQRHVVQLTGPITPTQRAALSVAGVQLGDYLPAHAFVADLADTTVAALDKLPFVAWVGAYQDEWKLDPWIGQRLAPFATPERKALADQGLLKIAITFFPDADLATGMADLQDLGVLVESGHLVGDQGVVGAIIDAAQLPNLAALPYIQFVEEASEVTLRNSTLRWVVQSNIDGVTPFYDNGIHGEGQVVGVVDGRVDKDHCSFDDSEPIGPTHRKILAYNASDGADSHGTHVGGTVVGDAGADDDTRGVAYMGKLVFDTIPSFTEAAIDSTLTTHHNQGARIHTNSWGDDGTTAYNGLARGFDVFQYDHEESLAILAVTNGSFLKNPENAKNLLAVGATQRVPNQETHCYGGQGPTADGRRKPEIFAPGCSTMSSYWNTTCSTRSSSGTSMATPAVSGAAMLVRQYYTDGYYPDGVPTPANGFTPSAALIKATLLNSAVDMTNEPGFPSNIEGWGRVLADNAAYFDGDARTLFVHQVWNADGLSTNESVSFQLMVTDAAEPLKATLVFTDAPGTSGASDPVVNDLDLTVTAPGGGPTYLGNYFVGGESAPGGSADPINNVEQVLIASPLTGRYTFTVAGTAVNQNAQGFALVVTGAISTGPAPPEAANLALETPVGQPLTVELVATDVDEDPLEYLVTTLPAVGTLSDPQAGVITSAPYLLANGGNELVYSPAPSYAGTQVFTYKADDGGVPPDGGLSGTASVTITVKAQPPQITTSSLPDGQVGVPYGPVQLAVAGGQPPNTWTLLEDVPYFETDLGTNAFAEVGTARGWRSDEGSWTLNLPFEFPYYNETHDSVRVSPNGMMFFGVNTGSAYLNSDAGLMDNLRIAPLWDDLRTTCTDCDIFVDQSVVGEVTVRWKGETVAMPNPPVNVAVTLHQAGAIDFHYGPGNVGVTATVGVSNGDGERYTFADYNPATTLPNANSIRFRKPDQLPSGLSVSPGGVVTGIPTAVGLFEPVVRVTDALGRFDDAALPLVVTAMPGDIDADGDVDTDDLAMFENCMAGPMASPPRVSPPTQEACLTAFDFNADGYVDLADFASFQGVFTGL